MAEAAYRGKWEKVGAAHRRWDRVGVVGVDAGLCWVGDPCYIKDGVPWAKLLEQTDDTAEYPQGVCTSTGMGDGTYNVYVRRSHGRVAALKVVFIPDEDDEEEAEVATTGDNGDNGDVLTPVRGCGTRVKGGVYLVCGLSPFGWPVEHFLMDPPIPLDVHQVGKLGVSPIGVHIVERKDGPPHVFDWVGSTHYENVADFVEEVKRYGMSRRAPVNLDFHALQPGSRQLLIHSRACIKAPWVAEYQRARMRLDGARKWCPKHLTEHGADGFETMCAALWWEDVEGEARRGQYADEWPRSITRTMPAFSYGAWQSPGLLTRTQYEVGIFMALPITGIHVIEDDKQGKHQRALQKLRGTALPVELRSD